MQADAGFLYHVQAGPPIAQALRMEAGPLRNTGLTPSGFAFAPVKA
jgi:hypothetical protein